MTSSLPASSWWRSLVLALLAALACMLLHACTPADPLQRSGEQPWTLLPRQGIERNGVRLVFGMERASVRALGKVLGAPISRRADEDDFSGADGTAIRVRYLAGKVRDIEFTGGALVLGDVALHRGARWATLSRQLAARGHAATKTDWRRDGYDIASLGINIATREQVGGDLGDDTIEWVVASSTPTHEAP